MRKIGVFLCHCGTNIIDKINMGEVAKATMKFEGVVCVVENLHFCSEEGQNVIREKINKHELGGIVIGACSPKLHESEFRKILDGTGVNPYLLEIVNLREQVSWCSDSIEAATKKAIDLVFMKVKKVSKLFPLNDERVPITQKALVIGAGIAGIEAALSIAQNGIEVLLVEREPFIGGNMTKLDKTFPTLDCSSCILAPRMMEVMNHPLINVCLNSSVTKVSGFVGNFTVSIEQKSRSIDVRKCTGCGKCIEQCPVRVEAEYEEGMSERPAIYKPFPQALPKAPFIDSKACLHYKNSKCGICSRVCPTGAINYEDDDKVIEEKIGAIIVATGFDMFEAGKYTEYGFDKYPDVITGLQFERLISTTGATAGKLLRPSDGKVPETIVFVHCVGSRDKQKGMAYCSKICCMATAKHVQIARDKIPDAQIYSFFIDIRAGGKDYQEFIDRATEQNIQFIKGRVSHIVKDGDKYLVKAENIFLGIPVRIKADLIVLANAIVPDKDAVKLARILGIECDSYGFYNSLHPKINPVSTAKEGIFIAGSCMSPMDIHDSVSHGAAAAVKVLSILQKEYIKKAPIFATINKLKCSGCMECRRVCYYGAIEQSILKGRRVAQVNSAACQGCGNCASQCKSGVIGLNDMTDEQINAEIIGSLYW